MEVGTSTIDIITAQGKIAGLYTFEKDDGKCVERRSAYTRNIQEVALANRIVLK